MGTINLTASDSELPQPPDESPIAEIVDVLSETLLHRALREAMKDEPRSHGWSVDGLAAALQRAKVDVKGVVGEFVTRTLQDCTYTTRHEIYSFCSEQAKGAHNPLHTHVHEIFHSQSPAPETDTL